MPPKHAKEFKEDNFKAGKTYALLVFTIYDLKLRHFKHFFLQ